MLDADVFVQLVIPPALPHEYWHCVVLPRLAPLLTGVAFTEHGDAGA
jgi:hypothetical protein